MAGSGRNGGRRNLGRRPKPRMVLAGGVYWPDEGLFRLLVNYLFENDDAIFAHNPLDEMRRLTLLGFCFKHGILEDYNGSEGMALLYQYRDKLAAAADATMLGQNVPTTENGSGLPQSPHKSQRRSRKGSLTGEERREAAVAVAPEEDGKPGWRVSRRSGSGSSTDAALTASPSQTIGAQTADNKHEQGYSDDVHVTNNDKISKNGTETTVIPYHEPVKTDDQSALHDVNTDNTSDDNTTTGRSDETGTAKHINPQAFTGFVG